MCICTRAASMKKRGKELPEPKGAKISPSCASQEIALMFWSSFSTAHGAKTRAPSSSYAHGAASKQQCAVALFPVGEKTSTKQNMTHEINGHCARRVPALNVSGAVHLERDTRHLPQCMWAPFGNGHTAAR